MLQKLRKRTDSGKLILITGLIYIISQIIILKILSPLGAEKVLRLQTTLSSAFVRQVLEQWKNTEEIKMYLTHYIFDFPHPIWYGLFFTSLCSKLLNKLNISGKMTPIILIPIVAGLLDIIEDINHLFFIKIPSTITPISVAFSGMASSIKWGLSLLIILICIFLLFKLIVNIIFNRKEEGNR